LAQSTRTTPFRLMTLHFSQIFLTLGRTFMTKPLELLGDLTSIGIVGRELQLDAIADDESDGLVSK
jgi:hypothetical protein